MKSKRYVWGLSMAVFFSGWISFLIYTQKKSDSSFQETNIDLISIQLVNQQYQIDTLGKQIHTMQIELTEKKSPELYKSKLNLIKNSNDEVVEAGWDLLENGLKSLKDKFNHKSFSKKALDLMEKHKKIKEDFESLKSKI